MFSSWPGADVQGAPLQNAVFSSLRSTPRFRQRRQTPGTSSLGSFVAKSLALGRQELVPLRGATPEPFQHFGSQRCPVWAPPLSNVWRVRPTEPAGFDAEAFPQLRAAAHGPGRAGPGLRSDLPHHPGAVASGGAGGVSRVGGSLALS